MGLTKSLVQRALTGVDGPGGLDLVTAGAVEWIAACDGHASVKIHLAGGADQAAMLDLVASCDRAIKAEARREGVAVDALTFQFVDHGGGVTFERTTGASAPAGAPAVVKERPGAGRVVGGAGAKPKASTPQQSADPLPGVGNIIAVGAGKGGVGKSTVAVNLAVGLAKRGRAVGILDGDIYGPSLPTLLGLDALEQQVLEGKLQPFAVHGVKAVTVGKLVEAEKPLIWRGPMAHGAFQQLTSRTAWGELDDLIIDLPPGTGDIPLTMAQSLRLTGAVIVCTPQRVAQDDAVRATRMFQQLGVEILGVVENMSYFVGDDGKVYDLFGRGGAEMMAQRLGLPFLGAVPITTALRTNGDEGEPLRNFEAGTAGGDRLPAALEALVTNLLSQASLASMRQGRSKPTLTIS